MKDEKSSLGHFHSTRWSLVGRAQLDSTGSRLLALDELLRLYLPALRAHLVLVKRIDAHRADDLLQGFVAEKILERDLIAQADRAKGRFRSLLLKSLENYVVDQARRERAQKRSPGAAFSLDHESAAEVASPPDSECSVFDAVWAKRTLVEVLRHMKQQCETRGTPHTWSVFEFRIVAPLLYGSDVVEYDDLVRRLGLSSPKQATNALATAKRQFLESLRVVVGQYTQNADELAAEIADLRAALAGAAAMDLSLASGPPPEPSGPPEAAAFDDTSPRVLARFLDLQKDAEAEWGEQELASIWRHQLSVPLATILADGKADAPPAKGQTLAGLLASEQPSLDALQALKRFAKSNTRLHPEGQLSSVATALYFASIAAALVRLDRRITRADDSVLRSGVQVVLDRGFLDENTTALFHAARSRLAPAPGAGTSGAAG